MLTTLVTTLVTVFGMTPDPGAPAVLGLISFVAVAAVAAAVTTLLTLLPRSDTGAARVRAGSIRRKAAAVGVVVVRDPDAPGRTRPRAPGGSAVSA